MAGLGPEAYLELSTPSEIRQCRCLVARWQASGFSREDKTEQVWDAATGNPLLTYRGHTKAVWSVAWSPDGTRLASAGRDKTVQVWEASTGSQLLTYRGHMQEVSAVA